jgi:hypothetical protein
MKRQAKEALLEVKPPRKDYYRSKSETPRFIAMLTRVHPPLVSVLRNFNPAHTFTLRSVLILSSPPHEDVPSGLFP